eukprot:TRINITY_DN43400_c0_g1_i1.p1 TRINITY_DN43400_c0_g1~~TRINITY_DN43400_c0_g1_i1.p1  ORF type:complete len:260 (-),score=30.40 TRINITY_DN43400_c0_g1_i1:72-851(-)
MPPRAPPMLRGVPQATRGLVPTPMFQNINFPVVAGQVVDGQAVDDDCGEVLQGQIERGPWHVSDLDVPEELQLERGNTQKIEEKFSRLSKQLVASSMCNVLLFLLTGVAYIIASLQVPTDCNVDLGSAFVQLGVCQVLLGITMAIFLGVARRMLWALEHLTKASKYRLEGREDEADSEESDYEEEAGTARTCLKVPRLVHTVAVFALVLLWVHAASMALVGVDNRCGLAVRAFWILAIPTAVTACYASLDGAGREASVL